MGTVIILIGVILLTTFVVYLARKEAVGLKDEQSSSYGIIKNEERHSLKYYIATPEGKTEGPFHPETLKVLARRKSITFETLICREGGNEWIKYGEFLSSIAKGKAFQNTDAPSLDSIPEPDRIDEKSYSADGISEAFKIIGSLSMIAGVILLVFCFSEKQPVMAVVYGLAGLLSCTACFWCAKVIELLCVLANKR